MDRLPGNLAKNLFFVFPAEGHSENELFELALMGGADDVSIDNGSAEIIGEVEAFKEINDQLEKADIEFEDAGIRMVPDQFVDLDASDTLRVMRLIEKIEELDDVQNVYSNLNITDQVMAQYEAA